MRRADPAALTGLEGARLRVGGLPAFSADYEDAVEGRMHLVVGLLVALFFAFRSLLVPLKMLGFALAVAVLLDATVIHMAIGPAPALTPSQGQASAAAMSRSNRRG